MKAFACGDVVPGCEARWVCSTEDEILFQVSEHARSAHGMSDVPPELAESVRAAITTVPD
jgi:predicted small metal-binding protein